MNGANKSLNSKAPFEKYLFHRIILILHRFFELHWCELLGLGERQQL